MKKLMEDVKAFHLACDVPILGSPIVPDYDRKQLRINLIEEEVNKELIPAMLADNLLEIADAMADSIYVIVGAALEYGIPLDKVWEAVQRANMNKVDPVTGKVRRREDGKILKPDGWQAPDIEKILKEASLA
jgi:predicted HAD superfamily Cof-like phosphohydrolase